MPLCCTRTRKDSFWRVQVADDIASRRHMSSLLVVSPEFLWIAIKVN